VRQVRFVRGKAKFCSLVATLCGVASYSSNGYDPATTVPAIESTCLFLNYYDCRDTGGGRIGNLLAHAREAAGHYFARTLGMMPTALAPSSTTVLSDTCSVGQVSIAQRNDDWWRSELGARWPLWVGLGALLLFVLGLSSPLIDPDLPMHLATGAWILQHRAVPWVEPFAWTRWGAPYYAYSWLPEIGYQMSYVYGGPVALRVLHGLTQVATGCAVLWLASVDRWKSWTALVLIFLTVVTSTIVAGFLRPQALLVPLVILSWGCGLRVLESSHPVRWAIALILVAATSANTHLLFPLTGLPLAVAVSRSNVSARRVALIAAALLIGWLTTPYGLAWPKVFALYFGHNPLFDYPSPITEFTPGFQFAAKQHLWLILASMLALIPWAIADAALTRRQRVVFGGMWLLGLVGFAMAARAIVVWWFAALPIVAIALERLPRPRTRRHRLVLMSTFFALPVALIVRFGRFDLSGGLDVAPPARASVDPLANWLDDHVRLSIGMRPRMLTNFDYGSYLTWRLPLYSMSVDGRTIFPDSAAMPDAYRQADGGPIPLGPWRYAELAIIPLKMPIAAVLDTAAGWVRLDTVPAGRGVPLASGLWAREDWLRVTAPDLHR